MRISEESCGEFRRAAEFAGRKWNAAILMGLHLGNERFSELKRNVPGITDRLLSARLQELTREGLVRRDVAPTHPVQVRYSLTEAGSELIQLLHPLVSWAHRWDTVFPDSKSTATGLERA
jgi:DNA-binding HxlR family transcriptional regulator